MKILVAVATGPEMRLVKAHLKALKLPELHLSFLITGVGSQNTIFTLTKYLSTYGEHLFPDFVINIGIAAYSTIKHPLTQIARIINFSTKKETIVPLPLVVAPLSTCVWSEDIQKESILPGEDHIADMESGAIDFVCQQFQLPRLLLKACSDRLGSDDRKGAQQELIQVLATLPYHDIFSSLLKYQAQTHGKFDRSTRGIRK